MVFPYLNEIIAPDHLFFKYVLNISAFLSIIPILAAGICALFQRQILRCKCNRLHFKAKRRQFRTKPELSQEKAFSYSTGLKISSISSIIFSFAVAMIDDGRSQGGSFP